MDMKNYSENVLNCAQKCPLSVLKLIFNAKHLQKAGNQLQP